MGNVKVAITFSMARQFLVVGLALMSIPIVTNAVGAEGFSRIVLIQLAGQVLALIVSGSIPSLLIHEVAKSTSESSMKSSTNVYAYVHTIAVLGLLSIAAFHFYFVPTPWGSWIALGLIVASVNMIDGFVTAVCAGIQRFVVSDSIGMLQPAIVLLAVIAFQPVLSVELTLFLYSAATLIASLVRVGYLWKIGQLGFFRPVRGEVFYLYKRASPLLLSNIFGLAVYRFHYIIISVIASPATLGAFALAQQIAEKLWIPAKAIASIFFPKFSTLTRSQISSVINKVHIAAAASAVVSLVPIVFLFFIPDWVPQKIFGDEFSEVTSLMIAMAIGVAAWAAVKVYASVFAAAGFFTSYLWISLAGVLATSVALVVLASLSSELLGWGISVGYAVGLGFALLLLRALK